MQINLIIALDLKLPFSMSRSWQNSV